MLQRLSRLQEEDPGGFHQVMKEAAQRLREGGHKEMAARVEEASQGDLSRLQPGANPQGGYLGPVQDVLGMLSSALPVVAGLL